MASLSRHTHERVSVIAHTLRHTPDLLLDDIAAMRLEWAQEAAAHLKTLKAKELSKKLFELQNSDRFDERLIYALYEGNRNYEQLRKQAREEMQAAQRKARLAARK